MGCSLCWLQAESRTDGCRPCHRRPGPAHPSQKARGAPALRVAARSLGGWDQWGQRRRGESLAENAALRSEGARELGRHRPPRGLWPLRRQRFHCPDGAVWCESVWGQARGRRGGKGRVARRPVQQQRGFGSRRLGRRVSHLLRGAGRRHRRRQRPLPWRGWLWWKPCFPGCTLRFGSGAQCCPGGREQQRNCVLCLAAGLCRPHGASRRPWDVECGLCGKASCRRRAAGATRFARESRHGRCGSFPRSPRWPRPGHGSRRPVRERSRRSPRRSSFARAPSPRPQPVRPVRPGPRAWRKPPPWSTGSARRGRGGAAQPGCRLGCGRTAMDRRRLKLPGWIGCGRLPPAQAGRPLRATPAPACACRPSGCCRQSGRTGDLGWPAAALRAVERVFPRARARARNVPPARLAAAPFPPSRPRRAVAAPVADQRRHAESLSARESAVRARGILARCARRRGCRTSPLAPSVRRAPPVPRLPFPWVGAPGTALHCQVGRAGVLACRSSCASRGLPLRAPGCVPVFPRSQ